MNLKATEQPIDTSSAARNAFFNILGVFAEFETTLHKERQMEGVAKAKSKGKYKGHQPTARAKSHQVICLIKEGFTRQAVAEKLDIGIASVYRGQKEYQKDNPTSLLSGYRSRTPTIATNVRLEIASLLLLKFMLKQRIALFQNK
ncbi:recombinase family protein [Shewanella sp. D64]|uniref:recombinase family protein n=1 Tax=unclassified Shewanella TaxID=196818 RepID=UPI0022BA5B0A|nr:MULTISPECIES: recombinase family protein [unclassified Shewanella]MEC4729098.1 recombinase family protein [Shewanella sp. D64]MEC4737335.1 recombinase family protein [Shewanella sp. E94]WBJ98127.1 recombinase family protein [Shewanella sp. MTB7]